MNPIENLAIAILNDRKVKSRNREGSIAQLLACFQLLGLKTSNYSSQSDRMGGVKRADFDEGGNHSTRAKTLDTGYNRLILSPHSMIVKVGGVIDDYLRQTESLITF